MLDIWATTNHIFVTSGFWEVHHDLCRKVDRTSDKIEIMPHILFFIR